DSPGKLTLLGARTALSGRSCNFRQDLQDFSGLTILSNDLVQFPEPLIENQYGRRDGGDNKSAKSECVLRAEVVRGSAREEVTDRHRPHEREQKHAHHAATHLIRNELLQESVGDRDRAHDRKAEPEE